MTKEPRIYRGERIVSSINGVTKTGQTTILDHIQKSTLNGVKT